MRLNDGTILIHDGAPYDPVKAHEYYIKTRHLKGRHKGPSRPVTVRSHTRNVSRGKGSSYTVRLSNGKTVTLTRQQLVEQRVYAAKRVSDIKNRLTELTSKLKQMMQEAHKKKADANKKPTAADKAKAAKQSKQYRQKHKQTLANKAKAAKAKTPAKKTKTTKDPVADLQHKITAIKDQLKTAIATQRALSAAKQNS